MRPGGFGEGHGERASAVSSWWVWSPIKEDAAHTSWLVTQTNLPVSSWWVWRPTKEDAAHASWLVTKTNLLSREALRLSTGAVVRGAQSTSRGAPWKRCARGIASRRFSECVGSCALSLGRGHFSSPGGRDWEYSTCRAATSTCLQEQTMGMRSCCIRSSKMPPRRVTPGAADSHGKSGEAAATQGELVSRFRPCKSLTRQ